MLKPQIPAIGEPITVMNVTGKVAFVEPQDDWHWRVEVEVVNAFGETEGLALIVPTDFRTDDGTPAY